MKAGHRSRAAGGSCGGYGHLGKNRAVVYFKISSR